MKKQASLILAIAMFLCFSIPCAAFSYRTLGYRGYLAYVRTGEFEKTKSAEYAPFVSYKQIQALGSFGTFQPCTDARDMYMYQVEDSAYGHILLDIYPDGRRSVYGENIPEITVENLVDPHYMTLISMEQIDSFFAVLKLGDLSYYYGYCDEGRPLLTSIMWHHGGNTYLLTPNHYPAGQDTLVGRLLNAETAEDALAELIADIDRGYSVEYAWRVVGELVAALVVISAAIALPIVIVKRKRKKKAARASGESLM